MKRYISIVIGSIFLFISCLDKDLENAMDERDVDFSKTEQMFEPVAGVYFEAAQCFSDWTGYALMSIRTHDLNKGSSSADQPELSNALNFQYSLLSDYWALDVAFKNYFSVVLSANGSLVLLDNYAEYLKTDAERALNAEYKAEVRFLRAYAYFFLARMWGDVPLVLDNNDIANTHLTLTSHAEIMKFVMDEVDAIEASMKALRPNEMDAPDGIGKGRVTKYSALGLKAKAAADVNNWDAVLATTNTIIDEGKFELYPDFYQYFKKPGRYCNENLYEMQFSDLKSGSGTVITSSSWFEFQGPRAGFVGADGSTLKGGWGFLTPNQELVKFFEARGEKDKVRATTTLLYTGTTTAEGDILAPNSGENAIINGKTYYPKSHMTEGRLDYGMGNNIRVLRYADILLLNAEAKVRKGQSGDTPFNLVRARAKMGTLNNVTVDQILEERRAEFAGEWGERYFDLVRTNKASSTLPRFVKGSSEYYPLPQSQIDLNPGFKK